MKLCVNCNFYVPTDPLVSCDHDRAQYTDPVDGKKRLIPCQSMRAIENWCGKAGNLWEPQPENAPKTAPISRQSDSDR